MPKNWTVDKSNRKRTRLQGPNVIGGRKSGKPARTLSTEDLQRYSRGEPGKNRVRAREELTRRGIAYDA